jgi:hypothetical protein
MDGGSARGETATYTQRHKHWNIQEHIQASSGIRTHDRNVWKCENISRVWQQGHCGRP